MFQSMCSTPFYGSDCEKDIVSMVSGVSSSLEKLYILLPIHYFTYFFYTILFKNTYLKKLGLKSDTPDTFFNKC